MDLNRTVLLLLQPLIFLLQPSKPPRALVSRGRLCCCGGLITPYYSHRWPGPTVTAASHRSRTSEPSYTSPRGHPLPRLPRLRVVPFLGLVVVHRPGALGTVWSTWSRNGFHHTWTVRGEANSWVHGRSKEVPPYYAQIIIPPPNSRDPPDGPSYFAKKCFPLTAGTNQLHLHTQGSA